MAISSSSVTTLAQAHTNQLHVDPGFAAAVSAGALQQKMEAVAGQHKAVGGGDPFGLEMGTNPSIAQRIAKRV